MANFVDNKEFLSLLKEYKITKREDHPAFDLNRNRIVYNRIGEIIDEMTKKLLFSPKFINYTPDWKGEMYSEAVYNCVRYMDNFDCENRNNPFAYYTQVIWNSFLQVLNKEKRIKMQKQVITDKVWDEVCPNGEMTDNKKVSE